MARDDQKSLAIFENAPPRGYGFRVRRIRFLKRRIEFFPLTPAQYAARSASHPTHVQQRSFTSSIHLLMRSRLPYARPLPAGIWYGRGVNGDWASIFLLSKKLVIAAGRPSIATAYGGSEWKNSANLRAFKALERLSFFTDSPEFTCI
jgi:hypothetical protein